MTDIIVRQQVIQIEIRLPVRLKKALPLLLALIFIRIEKNHLFSCMGADFSCHLIQGVRREEIVMIQKAGIVA